MKSGYMDLLGSTNWKETLKNCVPVLQPTCSINYLLAMMCPIARHTNLDNGSVNAYEMKSNALSLYTVSYETI
jgi:hypothetical protein